MNIVQRPLLLLALLSFLSLPASAVDLLPEVPSQDCRAAVVLPGREQMAQEVQDYLQLSEQALSMRASAVRLFHELQAKKQQGVALNGQDLLRMNQGAANLLAQRAELFERALAHECWTHTPPPAGREAGEIRRAGVLVSLSAALLLYDNYLSAISLYRADPTLRQHLNRADRGFAIPARELQRVDLMFASPENRRRVRRAIDWYRDYARDATPAEDALFAGVADARHYLRQSIEQSPSYRMVQRKNPLKTLSSAFEIFSAFSTDTLTGLKDEGVHLSSLLFGNSVGLVETRRGKLDARPEVIAQVSGALRAGDILLEKTPFRLTDTFIPGHWGHAALWIGTETELKALNLWEHPQVLPHHEAIRAGQGVVEALRSGVEMNSLAHFMNIDDLALLRPPDLSVAQRREALLQTLRQVGKEYDFNFNAESTERMFCSKLIYLAYGDIPWPTTRFLGRFTISPDNIAQRALEDGPLDVVLLYHDGEEIRAQRQAAMAQLLKNSTPPGQDVSRR